MNGQNDERKDEERLNRGTWKRLSREVRSEGEQKGDIATENLWEGGHGKRSRQQGDGEEEPNC